MLQKARPARVHTRRITKGAFVAPKSDFVLAEPVLETSEANVAIPQVVNPMAGLLDAYLPFIPETDEQIKGLLLGGAFSRNSHLYFGLAVRSKYDVAQVVGTDPILKDAHYRSRLIPGKPYGLIMWDANGDGQPDVVGGFWQVSLSAASLSLNVEELEGYRQTGKIIEVSILGYNKGGLKAKRAGVNCFVPFSQLLTAPLERISEAEMAKIMEPYVGKKLKVRVAKVAEQENPTTGKMGWSILLSEKKACQSLESLWEDFDILALKGQFVFVKVIGSKEFGVFGEIMPGLTGLIHISEMPVGFALEPETFAKVGEMILVKVLSVDEEARRINLSRLEAIDAMYWLAEEICPRLGLEIDADEFAARNLAFQAILEAILAKGLRPAKAAAAIKNIVVMAENMTEAKAGLAEFLELSLEEDYLQIPFKVFYLKMRAANF